MRKFLTVPALLLLELCSGGAFVPTVPNSFLSRTELCASSEEESSVNTRRQALVQASHALGALLLVGGTPNPAFAAKDELLGDKEKIRAGYKRLNYLVDNWDKETTDCKTKTQYSSASSECERTPLVVQYYLGYRSTEDPLFRADKTMRRLEVLVPTGAEVDYLEAMEKFNEKAEEGSGMSYISSWGEANPGGGKDRVEVFVNRAKANVIDARDALGVIVKILDL